VKTDEVAYFRLEWDIASDSADPRHSHPPPINGRTLDVGCGCGSPVGVLGNDVVGVDLNVEAMALGRQWGAPHRFVASAGEALPFRSGTFDRVIARVSLPYMHIDSALSEMARVSRPGAELWLTLHSMGLAFRFLRQSRGRAMLRRLYVMLNGLLLHFTGKQLRLRGVSETFQTDRSIRRALARAGFRSIKVQQGTHYIVRANQGVPA
jgi:ubiquinone/menaquinone biosynthesis C-methylase UbiE